MADPLSPDAGGGYNPMQIRVPGGRGALVTPGEAMTTLPAGTVPNLGAVLQQSPALQNFMNNALDSLGIAQFGPNRDLAREVALQAAPVHYDDRAVPYETIPGDVQTYKDQRPFDLLEAIGHGFGESLIGGLTKFHTLGDASRYEADPTYDVWADPQVTAAGLQNQYELFRGSRSAAMTNWLIGRYKQKQRDAANWDSMGGHKELVSFGAGLIGDPLNWIPGMAGVRGPELAAKALSGALSGPERALLAVSKPIYGTLADGARNFTIMAAANVAANALQNGIDPTDQANRVAGDVVLPSAISASLGMLLGAAGRFSAKLNALASDARKATFLHGTLPTGSRTFEQDAAGARFVDPAFVGPTVPADREAAEALLRPADLRGETEYQRIEAVRPTTAHDPGGVLPPGSLATDYGPMRKREFYDNPANEPYLRHADGFDLPPDEPAGSWRAVTPDEVFEPGRRFRMNQETGAAEVLEPAAAAGEGSVGAAITPGSKLYREDVLAAQGRQAPTGLGLERLPTDPWQRAALGESVSMMELMQNLVSSGGRLLMGNFDGVASLPPVETMIQVIWNHPLATNLRYNADQWAAYRQMLAAGNQLPPDAASLAGRTDMQRLKFQIGQTIKDKIVPGEKGLSFGEFRDRVGKGLSGDADRIDDAATPYVNKAIANDRALYNRVRDQMIEHGVFKEAYENAKYDAWAEVRAVKKEADEIKDRANIERWPAARERAAEEALMARMEDAEFKAKKREDELTRLMEHGPTLGNTAKTYRPRMADAGEVERREQDFVVRVSDWLQTAQGGHLEQQEAVRIAKEIQQIYAKANPIYERADQQALFKGVASPSSAMARSFQIPDDLIEDFLITDSEVLMRYHIRQAGAAIEMKKRFGNLDLAEQIAAIEQDYRGKIVAANEGSDVATPEAIRLTKLMKQAIYDAQAVRDKIYGTYGAANDPSRLSSRMIRMAKQYTNLTLLGLSGVTALGDMMRPLMTEGLDATYGIALRSLMGDSRSTIWRMAGEEGELMGDCMDMIKNVRALSAADTGDIFGSRGPFERRLSQANSLFFVANGLNTITDFTKKWALTVIMGRINPMLHAASGGEWASGKLEARFAHLADDELQQMMAGAESRLSAIPSSSLGDAQAVREEIVGYQRELDARTGGGETGVMTARDTARFAAANIGPEEARRIGLMLKINKQMYGSLMMPNTEKWTDQEAAILYRSALNQMVNRTIPTPGIGDRPNWMSTEWGSLISQYKSFAVAAQIRQLQSGLQEGGGQFWYGAAAMVGFAVLLNEIRSRLYYDKSTFDKAPTAVIADAVDRSSLLGYFSDANRALEALTGNRLGVKPMLGDARPRPVNYAQATGAVLGPAAGQAVRAASVADDFIQGHPTARTWANARTLIPGQNLGFMDPAMDRLVSTGSYHPLADQARRLNQADQAQRAEQRNIELARKASLGGAP